ncbi:MAG: hypothetical protein IKY98_05555 [Alphaproteobacteria bacterium]|nr:hypothetical protein [Alphaproteobacteria bacterium]
MRKTCDIPFSKDSAGLFLPWISMLMIFIASLTLAGGLTAYRGLSAWNADVSGAMTVQIPTTDDKGNSIGDLVNEQIEKALTVLRTSPGVMGARVLDDEQMFRLMTPWIGQNADIASLPLPKVIDVAVDPRNPPILDQLSQELAEQVPSAVLDTHRIWLDNLIAMANGFMKLTVFILGLLILTTAFTVIYSSRTSLGVHKKVIRLIHLMGANDLYIAWQYAYRVFKLTFLGGLFGLLLSMPIIFGVGYFFQTLGAHFDISMHPVDIVILVSLPVFFAVLSFMTTLQTVLKSLKRML